MNNRVLVTGGAGFIGVNLTSKLLKLGHRVTIFDNFSRAGSRENCKWLFENFNSKLLSVLAKDIRDRAAISKAVGEADVVFHLAAQTAVTTSVASPREDFEINALGSFNVYEAARRRRSMPIVVFASTNKVYGEFGGVKVKKGKTRYLFTENKRGIDETFPLDFHSPYGCSKGVADQYGRDYFRIYGLPTVIFRQSCIYGPRQMGVEDQGWVAYFAIAAILSRPIVIYGDGLQVRDILYIDDLTDLYIKAVEKIDKVRGKIFNVGGGAQNSVSLVEYLDYLGKLNGQRIKVKYSDWRPGDQKIFIADCDLARKNLGWKPRTNWREGVLKMFDWISRNKKILAKI